MSLIPDEIEALRTHVKHQDRWNRLWPRWRWIVLLLAIAQIAAAIHSYVKVERFSDATSLSALGIEDNQVSQLIDSIIEVRTDLLRKEMRMYVGVIVSASVGLALLCFCVLSWRRPAHSAAQYFLVKQELKRHEEIPGGT